VGAVIEADGEASDQQCDSGLHVFRVGVRPEWHGLCEPDHDLVMVEVEVDGDDILFGGMPGNMDKLRVRRLRVLT
jgi:hypothetical protein